MRAFQRSLFLLLLVPVLPIVSLGCSSRQTSPEFGAMESRRTSGNVITADDIRRYPSASSVEELLVQLVPGINVTRGNDGALAVHIMGLSSGRAGQGALTVIDGVPIQSGSIGVNPRDVQRIEVLRDGGSTALYGFRGANGVIVITTKVQDL